MSEVSVSIPTGLKGQFRNPLEIKPKPLEEQPTQSMPSVNAPPHPTAETKEFSTTSLLPKNESFLSHWLGRFFHSRSKAETSTFSPTPAPIPGARAFPREITHRVTEIHPKGPADEHVYTKTEYPYEKQQ